LSSAVRLSWSRKLLHLAVALLPAVGWRVSYQLELALAGALLGASVVVEIGRYRWPRLNRLLWRLMPTTFRAWEDRQVLGSTWLAVGVLATLLLFGRHVGGTAVLFLVWGDPAAELVASQWRRVAGGERRGPSTQDGSGKTVVGSLGCLAACLVAGGVGVGLGGLELWAGIGGALVATLVERWSPPPDDNVWMPILSGLAVLAIQGLVGG
jgi:dolichol kinase